MKKTWGSDVQASQVQSEANYSLVGFHLSSIITTLVGPLIGSTKLETSENLVEISW